MKLLPLRDVPARGTGPVFKNQSWRALAAVIGVFFVIFCYVIIPKGEPTPAELYAVPLLAMLFFAVLLAVRLRLCLRKENWLLKSGNEGLFIHLRSFLNHHLPEDGPTVLYLADQEIRSVRLCREDRYLPGRHGGSKSHDRFSYVDIALAPANGEAGITALDEALHRERRLPGPRRDDYPVRLLDDGDIPILRLVWDQIRPGEERALRFLEARYPREPDTSTETRFSDELTEQEQQAFIAALWEMGYVEDAEHIVSAKRGISRQRARAYLRETFEQEPR